MEVILYPVSTKFEFKILKFGNLKLSLLGIIINKSRKFESHSKVKLMTNRPKFFQSVIDDSANVCGIYGMW